MFGSSLQRTTPALPAHAYVTYGISTPAEDAFRPATCDEVDCPNYRLGWVINADTVTERGQRQVTLIRNLRTHRFREMRGVSIDQNGVATEATTTIAFVFEAGQSCFSAHKVRTAKPELYTVRDGDWRSLGNARVHTKPEDWVDDFQNNQQKVIETLERG